MKKVLSILTVVMLSLGLAACSATPAETVINEVSSTLNVSGATVEEMQASAEPSYLLQLKNDIATVTPDELGITDQSKIDALNNGIAEFNKFYDLVGDAFIDTTPVYGYGIFVSNQCEDCVIAADLSESGVNMDAIDFDSINETMQMIYQEPDFFYGKGATYTSASGAMTSSGAQIKSIVDAAVTE